MLVENEPSLCGSYRLQHGQIKVAQTTKESTDAMASENTSTALTVDSTLTATATDAARAGDASELPTAASDSKGRFRCDVEGCKARFYSKQSQAYHLRAHDRGSLKLCAKCSTSWGLRPFCEDCISLLASSGTSICKDCLQELPLDNFAPERKALFGRHSRCHSCSKTYSARRRATLDGFLSGLYKGCIISCQNRLKAGREDAAVMTLTKADFRKMWDAQGGKCFYSGLTMSASPHADWKCSPERLNPALGYIEGNVVLTIQELNGPRQWTWKKIQQIRTLVDSAVPDDFQASLAAAMKSPPQQNSDKPPRTKVEKGLTFVECTDCSVFKVRHQMHHSRCKDCHNAKIRVRRCTLRGRLQHILSTAKARSKVRALRENSCRSDNTSSVTLDDLFSLLKSQNGRCAYSNIPLTYAGNDWTVSLERLDCGRGYHVGNVCFVAVEFNTGDYSCRGPERKTSGSGAWSVAKFKVFLAALKSNDDKDMPQVKRSSELQSLE